MFDFIIEMLADIADFFLDLWLNKILNRKGTKKQMESREEL